MKKFLSVIMLSATLISFAQDKAIKYNQVPKTGQQFINKYFGAKQVGSVMLDDDYFSKEVKGMISNFFNNSATQFASFFAKSNNMSVEELEKLRDIIDNEIDRKKK